MVVDEVAMLRTRFDYAYACCRERDGGGSRDLHVLRGEGSHCLIVRNP